MLMKIRIRWRAAWAVLVVLCVGSGCTTGRYHPANTIARALFSQETDFDGAWERAERQTSRESTVAYLRHSAPDRLWTVERPKTANSIAVQNWPAEKAIRECVTAIFPQIEETHMVFRLSALGEVERAMTSQPGWVDDCVRRKVNGLFTAAPPHGNFYLCHKFKRLGDSRYQLEGCGDAFWRTECTVTGTVTRCRSEFLQPK